MKTKLHLSLFSNIHVSRTFFRSALMTAVVLLLALGVVKLLAPFSSSAKQSSQSGAGRQYIAQSGQGAASCPTCSPAKQRMIYAPLFDVPESSGSEISLNCRSAHDLVITPTFYAAAGLTSQPAQKLQRLPLEKKKFELKSPSSWSKRAVKIDPKTNQEISYDPKPRIELFDAKALKYYLKWIGYDGKEKVIVYQRRDCIDIVVSAIAKKSPSSGYEYVYTVHNLESSGDYLHGFAIQNFSSDVKPEMSNDIRAGNMRIKTQDFNEGNWIRFAPLPPHPRVQPGQLIEFKLYSPSPPGLVMCSADGGDFIMKGVGEDMPSELEVSLPGYEILPRGFTIGPVDNLKNTPSSEKIAYLLKILPRFQKQRWITAQTSQAYEQLLKRGNLQGIFSRLDSDFKTDSITTEIFTIIGGMKT